LQPQKFTYFMTTKLIILLVVGGLALGLLIWIFIRAIRYHQHNPNDTYWPYYGEWNNKSENN